MAIGKRDHSALKIKCKLDTHTVDNCIGKLKYGKSEYEKLDIQGAPIKNNPLVLYANIHPTYHANFIEITDIVPQIQQFKL